MPDGKVSALDCVNAQGLPATLTRTKGFSLEPSTAWRMYVSRASQVRMHMDALCSCVSNIGTLVSCLWRPHQLFAQHPVASRES